MPEGRYRIWARTITRHFGIFSRYYDLRVYLEKRFGRAKKFGSFEESDLSDVRGVIMFAFRHVDLWNGSEVRYNTDFTDGTKTVKEILVWEAP
jgi:hypothetical protein